jgi:sulfur relay protein TusB/DsrH
MKLFLLNRQDEKALDIALGSQSGGIILFQDAVYYLNKNSLQRNRLVELIKKGLKVYALESDVNKRGIKDILLKGVEMLTYERLVDILFSDKKVINL